MERTLLALFSPPPTDVTIKGLVELPFQHIPKNQFFEPNSLTQNEGEITHGSKGWY